MISTTQIGIGMIIIPVAVIACFVIGMLFYCITRETIKAWIEMNVIKLSLLLLAWSFIIGTALVLIRGI